MIEGFYYDIYPPMRIGGGPAREIYPVEQQNLDALEGSLRVQAGNARITQEYQRMGIWGPTELPRNIVEANEGRIFNRTA